VVVLVGFPIGHLYPLRALGRVYVAVAGVVVVVVDVAVVDVVAVFGALFVAAGVGDYSMTDQTVDR